MKGARGVTSEHRRVQMHRGLQMSMRGYEHSRGSSMGNMLLVRHLPPPPTNFIFVLSLLFKFFELFYVHI